MLSGKDLYRIWAPDESIWSRWVSPALFAPIECMHGTGASTPALASLTWPEVSTLSQAAAVIDLPGADAIRFAIALARRGYRPVPVINASPGPSSLPFSRSSAGNKSLDLNALANEICAATFFLQNLSLPPTSLPAFILDSKRLSGDKEASKEIYDNRWMVFPEDFPSAAFMIERGIKQVILVQQDNWPPQTDIAGVLVKWQRSGIEVLLKVSTATDAPHKITVSAENRVIEFVHRLLISLGVSHGSVGGFGSSSPEFFRAG